jgi:hypothetical protein
MGEGRKGLRREGELNLSRDGTFALSLRCNNPLPMRYFVWRPLLRCAILAPD